MKRKNVPAKKRINPIAIQTKDVKYVSDFNIFSYNKIIEVVKISNDSMPVGIESNSFSGFL